MTFSVEIADSDDLKQSGHRVEIWIDKDNLKSFIQRLSGLINQEPGDHIHFMSESWGLGDLTVQSHLDQNIITHHLEVIICE